METDAGLRIGAAVLGGVGGLLLLIAVVILVRTRRFLEGAVATTGTVVGHVMSRDSEGSVSYRPQVRFISGDGRPFEFVDGLGTNPPRPAEGAPVPVRYDPQRPDKARIASKFRLWFVPVLLGGLGLIMLVAGGILFAAS